MIALRTGPFGTYRIVNDDNTDDVLVQTDWDYPGIASTFGWWIGAVAPNGCTHDGTDGTIDCPGCGTPASVFIEAAGDYLDENIGAVADDPGYFHD
jgi:hypothetical protein